MLDHNLTVELEETKRICIDAFMRGDVDAWASAVRKLKVLLRGTDEMAAKIKARHERALCAREANPGTTIVNGRHKTADGRFAAAPPPGQGGKNQTEAPSGAS